MRLGRLWLVLGLVAVVAMVVLGYRFRVMMAGGKAVMVLAIVGVLAWLALRRGASRDLDTDRDDAR